MIGTPRSGQLLGEVRRRADAISQVRLFDDLLEAARDRLEVVAGQPAVGRKSLGQNQQVARTAPPSRRCSSRGSRRCSPGRPSSPTSCSRRRARTSRARSRAACGRAVPGLALLDEPRVLGEAAGVEEERLAVAVAERADAAQVLQRHRLAAAGVVRDRHHHQRHAVAARARQQPPRARRGRCCP